MTPPVPLRETRAALAVSTLARIVLGAGALALVAGGGLLVASRRRQQA